MKRALLVALLLVAGCSHGGGRTALPTPTREAGSTPSAAAPSTTPSSSPSATLPGRPVAAPVGPAGTAVPRGFVPRSATFVSARTGWVLGASPCPSGKGSCDVIARTRDGGATWRAIPSPRTSPDALAQIRFADERNGFVSGRQLWATHDGGATWQPVPGAADASALAAADGRVWVVRGSDLLSAPATGGAFGVEQRHVAAAIWLHGSTVAYTAASGSPLLLSTHGGTGRPVRTPCSADGHPVLGFGSGHWLLVCELPAGLGHEEKHAYTSTDGGATWKPAGDPPQVTGTAAFVTDDGDLVVDNQEVAARRGGWQTVLSSQGGLSEGGFESASLGYAIGGFDGGPDQAMKITHDAGRTWSVVAF